LSTEISIREATLDDRLTLWSWYREPLRRIVFPSDHDVSREHHKKWWQAIKADPNVSVFVGLVDIIRIGCVRCQRDNNNGVELFPYLKPAYHRQNLMAPFLSLVMNQYAEIHPVAGFRLNVTTANPRVIDVLPPGARSEPTEGSHQTTFNWAVGT
jgi:hypothetical protein